MAKNKELSKVIKNLYNIWLVRGCKMCKDSDWSNVLKLVTMFRHSYGVNELSCSSGRYVNYLDNDGDKSPYRDYDIKIDTDFGKIEGYIRCCSAGTINDPFSMYDIVISFWEAEDSINESIKDHLNFNFAGLTNELSQAKNLQDLKKLGKKYVKELATVGAFMTIVLANCQMPEPYYQELSRDVTEYAIEQEYYEDDYAELADEPQWDLICSDVEATVYNAVESQCNSDVSNTASMFKLNLKNPEAHKIIAMERTMMAQYDLHYGDIVKIEGTGSRDGIYQIQDTMNKKYKGRHKIDILVDNNTKYGQWDNVEIYKLSNPEDYAGELKSSFAPAKNQEKIDKRQGYDYLYNSESEGLS